MLRAWKGQQATERLKLGPACADNGGDVVTWPDGRPVMPDYVTKTWLRIQRLVNHSLVDEHAKTRVDSAASVLPLLVVHGTRHTHATILLRSLVPVHIVAKRRGHMDPSVTLNVYADVIPDDNSSAVDVYVQTVRG